MRTTILGLLISVLCAASGSAFAWWLATPEAVPEIGPTERALNAAEGLRDSNVYVDPTARGFLDERQIARLEKAAAASDPEVFLVVWPKSLEAGYAISSDVLRQTGAQLGRPGVYVEVDPGGGLTDEQVGIEGSSTSFLEPGDENWSGQRATDQLLRLIEQNDGDSYEKVAITDSPESGYWGGIAGNIGIGVFLGALGALVVGLSGIAVWFTVRARRIAAAKNAPGENAPDGKATGGTVPEGALSKRARRKRAASRRGKGRK